MPDLLLELFSEEIPARMQARAAEDLRKLVTERLVDAGLVYEGAKAFATPRRLALVRAGHSRAPAGPAGGAEGAARRRARRGGAGLSRSAGLSSIAEASIQRDPKKGDFYVALVEKPGRPALDVLSEMLPVVVRTFPWPKSMRWGDGRLTWVRPLHAIVATFGPETEDPDIVPFSVDGVAAGDATRGHRFLAPKAFHVRRFDDYVRKLEAGESRARSGAAQGHHPARRPPARFCARARTRRGRGFARRGRRPRRMAGRADGVVRSRLPRHSGRSDPHDHPQQPEMLCRARSIACP